MHEIRQEVVQAGRIDGRQVFRKAGRRSGRK